MLRDRLIETIREFQKSALGRLNSHLQLGGVNYGCLWFGYGRFQNDKVLWWPGEGEPVELTVEEGVDRLLAYYDLN